VDKYRVLVQSLVSRSFTFFLSMKSSIYQPTPFIVPTKCRYLISQIIKCASTTCFGTSVLSSERTQSQFLKHNRYCKSLTYSFLDL